MDSDHIVAYLNSTNQTYFFIFFMEKKQNVWGPWYLMPQDKPCKVECGFCNNDISYNKDKMLFHLKCIDMMAMGELES